jgi:hypothetical protein
MRYTAPEFRFTCNRLHGVIFQKIELDMFILLTSVVVYLVFSMYASMFVSDVVSPVDNFMEGNCCLLNKISGMAILFLNACWKQKQLTW